MSLRSVSGSMDRVRRTVSSLYVLGLEAIYMPGDMAGPRSAEGQRREHSPGAVVVEDGIWRAKREVRDGRRMLPARARGWGWKERQGQLCWCLTGACEGRVLGETRTTQQLVFLPERF